VRRARGPKTCRTRPLLEQRSGRAQRRAGSAACRAERASVTRARTHVRSPTTTGDYNLPLLDGLATVPGLTMVNTANELNAAVRRGAPPPPARSPARPPARPQPAPRSGRTRLAPASPER
jgi:hypothetical protein